MYKASEVAGFFSSASTMSTIRVTVKS